MASYTAADIHRIVKRTTAEQQKAERLEDPIAVLKVLRALRPVKPK